MILKMMIEYFGRDVRRINHAIKVYGFANTICRNEKLSEKEINIIEIAAILHDIGIPISEQKYGTCIGKYQEIEGPPIAREMLLKIDVNNEIIDRVCYLIGNHHSYQKIDGIDFQILVEADFLVNINEDNMDDKMISSIKEKYFKTKHGQLLLKTMYD